jgi:hypothetical protein
MEMENREVEYLFLGRSGYGRGHWGFGDTPALAKAGCRSQGWHPIGSRYRDGDFRQGWTLFECLKVANVRPSEYDGSLIWNQVKGFTHRELIPKVIRINPGGINSKPRKATPDDQLTVDAWRNIDMDTVITETKVPTYSW